MNIIWSPEILEDVENLAEYLQMEWPASVWDDFTNEFFRKINLLSLGILRGRPAQKDSSVLSISISKHNKLYYEVKNYTLFLLRLWDTRQNPSRHPYE